MASESIMLIGWRTSGSFVKFMMPSWTAEVPTWIGFHKPETICYSTGIDVEPNLTSYLATPRTGIEKLLYAFILMWDGVIWLRIFQLVACSAPQTDTCTNVWYSWWQSIVDDHRGTIIVVRFDLCFGKWFSANNFELIVSRSWDGSSWVLRLMLYTFYFL